MRWNKALNDLLSTYGAHPDLPPTSINDIIKRDPTRLCPDCSSSCSFTNGTLRCADPDRMTDYYVTKMIKASLPEELKNELKGVGWEPDEFCFARYHYNTVMREVAGMSEDVMPRYTTAAESAVRGLMSLHQDWTRGGKLYTLSTSATIPPNGSQPSGHVCMANPIKIFVIRFASTLPAAN